MTPDEVEPGDHERDAGVTHPPDTEPLGPGTVLMTAAESVTTVALAGEVDISLAAELTEMSRAAVERGRPIQLDVRAVTFIDSTAIGYLVTLAGVRT